MIGSWVWNHWFWVTLTAVSRCSCESLLIQPYDVTAPLLQSFPAGELVREEGQGETDDGREPIIFSDDKRNVMVSKSVSVSRVSVEIGGVRVEKNINKTDIKLPSNIISEKTSINTMKPQSFFQTVISKLKSDVSINVGERGDNSPHLESQADLYYNSAADDQHTDEYQLVYRDEEYVGDNFDTTSEEVEYLNYLYDMYGDDVYSDSIIISDALQENNNDDYNAPIVYNDDIEGEKNAFETSVIDNQSSKSLENLVTVSQKSDLVRSRSDQARGRSLILHVDDIKYFSEEREEIHEDALKAEHIVIVQNTERIFTKDPNLDTDFSVDVSSSRKSLAMKIKIGIFVGVVMGVLISAVVAVLFRRRKTKSAKLVIDEDQSTTDSQFAFSRGLKHEDSGRREHFNNHIGKSSYSCDDLHSLDNDSFLTSLETIQHGKDRRNVLLL